MATRDRTPWLWGCSKCGRPDRSLPEDVLEEYNESQLEEHERKTRIKRGCDVEDLVQVNRPPVPIGNEGFSFGLRKCPWSMDGVDDAWRYISVYTNSIHEQFGFLPFPGDAGDQPAHIYEAIEICLEAEAEAQLAIDKEFKRNQRRQQQEQQNKTKGRK